MSWDSVNKASRGDTLENASAEDPHEGLRQAARRAVHGQDQKELRGYLRKVVTSGSYQSGRTPEDVAHAEGVRALAARILHLAGDENDE